MKIAHIVPVFPPHKGGTGNAACHMALEAAMRNHEVSVFTPRYGSEPVEEDYRGLRVVRLRPVIKYGKAAFVPQLFFALRDFDILHLHYPFFGGAEAVWLLKLRRGSKTRLIISYHMDVVGTGVRAWIFRTHRRLFLERILSAADKVIVSSLDYAMHSYIQGHSGDRRMVEIPYGCDSRFAPQEKDSGLKKYLGIHEDELVILFVGSFEYFKGIDCLMQSAREIRGKIKVVMVGGGELMDKYRKMVDDLGLADKICLTGFSDDDTLVKYYNLADIFVLPSIDRTEAFGIVLIEAMACGKPVVASDLPGVRSVVDDGVNGFLARPGDPVDLAGKIQRLMEDESMRNSFGRRGREKVLEKYLWDKIGDKLMEVYTG